MKKHKPQHRQYTIKHVPGQHLNLYERIIIARDWNAAIEADSASLTIRSFGHLRKYLGAKFTTRAPTLLARRERLIMPIALCGAGIPKEPISLVLRAGMC